MAELNAQLGNEDWTGKPQPVPPGEYEVEVEDSKAGVAQSSGNKTVTFVYNVVNPPEFHGRKIYDVIPYELEWAKHKLGTLARACRHYDPNNLRRSEDLHGKTFLATVKIRQQEGYDPQNQIQEYKPLSTGMAMLSTGMAMPPGGPGTTPSTPGPQVASQPVTPPPSQVAFGGAPGQGAAYGHAPSEPSNGNVHPVSVPTNTTPAPTTQGQTSQDAGGSPPPAQPQGQPTTQDGTATATKPWEQPNG